MFSHSPFFLIPLLSAHQDIGGAVFTAIVNFSIAPSPLLLYKKIPCTTYSVMHGTYQRGSTLLACINIKKNRPLMIVT